MNAGNVHTHFNGIGLLILCKRMNEKAEENEGEKQGGFSHSSLDFELKNNT
jgi:hypothetical protein